MFSKKREEPSPAGTPRCVANGGPTFSVIGADVTIRGDISASADLHVDGTIEGDIACASLVQGETSRIEGMVEAERARLAGRTKGTITARELVILKTAVIEGDVHYDSLTIEQGAQVEGRLAQGAGKQATPQKKAPAAVPELGVEEEQRLTIAN